MGKRWSKSHFRRLKTQKSCQMSSFWCGGRQELFWAPSSHPTLGFPKLQGRSWAAFSALANLTGLEGQSFGLWVSRVRIWGFGFWGGFRVERGQGFMISTIDVSTTDSCHQGTFAKTERLVISCICNQDTLPSWQQA